MEREMVSICITVRPKNGLQGEYATSVEKWLMKQNYYVYVYEMEDEARHLHAQLWGKYQRDNVRKALYRIAEKFDLDWSPASKKVLGSGVKYGYNDEFYKKYMIKENKPVYGPIPEDTSIYYPSLEEQENIKNKATRVADAYFNNLRNEWLEQNPEYETHQFTNVDVAKFYYNMMFKDKKIAVIRNDMQRKQNAKCLLHYIYPNLFCVKEMVLSNSDVEIFNLFKEST